MAKKFRVEVPDEFKELAHLALEKYFAEFSGVRRYIDSTIEQAHKDGFVKSAFGRIEYLPDINSKHREKVSEAERQAINMPIQSTASDITQKAVITADSWIGGVLSQWETASAWAGWVRDRLQGILTAGLATAPAEWELVSVNCVHDSLVFECRAEFAEEAALLLQKLCQYGDDLPFMKVPLVADIEIGDSYGDLSPYPPEEKS